MNEQALWNALHTTLKSYNCIAQRIESGVTGRGIPDLYLRTPKREIWVELKVTSASKVEDEWFKIPWRQGQQAWHLRYYKLTKLCGYTLVEVRDGYILIPMVKLFHNNIVNQKDVIGAYKLRELVTWMINV